MVCSGVLGTKAQKNVGFFFFFMAQFLSSPPLSLSPLSFWYSFLSHFSILTFIIPYFPGLGGTCR